MSMRLALTVVIYCHQLDTILDSLPRNTLQGLKAQYLTVDSSECALKD